MTAIRIDKVFEDPDAVRALVEHYGPYRALASYLPVSGTRGVQTTAADGAKLILENPRLRETASAYSTTPT
jgi:hypothetical protein